MNLHDTNRPLPFDRQQMMAALQSRPSWDLIVIGGGATGLGTALDAASRGYATLLLEQHDFAKGTSSRSTKLAHGGIRYLAQGDLRLVYGALRERSILLRNAPHTAHLQRFAIPCYSWWDVFKYTTGLKIYDLLAGSKGFERSGFAGAAKTSGRLPALQSRGLKGAVYYVDGQFDDARLAIQLGRTAADQGAVLLNYVRVTQLTHNNGRVSGVLAQDMETGTLHPLRAKVVVNATGVFVDGIIQMDRPGAAPVVSPSQGVHIVVDKRFLPGNHALVIPKTSDGRVLFAVPWQEHLLIGTTDVPVSSPTLEPVARESEIDFILDSIGRYLTHPPTKKDVLSTFAGLRPLAADFGSGKATKEISRDHKLITSASGLITITGGKWTTYRKMAEDTVGAAVRVAGLPPRPCTTHHIAISDSVTGFPQPGQPGKNDPTRQTLLNENPQWSAPLATGHPYTLADVVWAVRFEMARTVEDVLCRRTRLLLLDTRAALAAAPAVAETIRQELRLPEEWKNSQLRAFGELASGYLTASSAH